MAEAFNVFFIRIKSEFSKLEPEGKHRPLSNRLSEIPFKYAGYLEKMGCKCIGFQSGLASIFSFAKSSLIFSRSLNEPNKKVESHLFEKYSSGSNMVSCFKFSW